MINNNVEKYIILTTIIRQEENVWTAVCEELGTSTFGNTFEEAIENLHEAVELHLNTLEDVKECKRFLKENSIKIYRRRPKRVKTEFFVEPGSFLRRNIQTIHAYC